MQISNTNYGSRYFCCKGYYEDAVGRNKNAIAEYIENQLQGDIASDQISLKEYADLHCFRSRENKPSVARIFGHLFTGDKSPKT